MGQTIAHVALVVRDYDEAIEFVRGPSVTGYGTVAVFKDLYGNLLDLVGPAADASSEHAAWRGSI